MTTAIVRLRVSSDVCSYFIKLWTRSKVSYEKQGKPHPPYQFPLASISTWGLITPLIPKGEMGEKLGGPSINSFFLILFFQHFNSSQTATSWVWRLVTSPSSLPFHLSLFLYPLTLPLPYPLLPLVQGGGLKWREDKRASIIIFSAIFSYLKNF